MINSPYLYEKLVATHQAEVRRDMQRSRKPVHADRQRTSALPAVNRLGTWMVELGLRLQGTEQRETSLS